MLRERLSTGEGSTLLDLLGLAKAEPSESFLSSLQRAWIFAQPFHNLDVLAARRSGEPPLGPEGAIGRCLRGLGGPCHVQSFAFRALLDALGFDAQFCGSTIAHQDDHLVVRVSIRGRLFFSDVGNGQPYLLPFPADQVLRQEHLGWVVVSRPTEDGIEVERSSPDQPRPRRVYRATPEPREWADFEETVRRHHAEPGFGPFLTGLRAVRIGAEQMITVRDLTVTRYAALGFDQIECTREQLAVVLREGLALHELPIDDAVRAWAAARSAA